MFRFGKVVGYSIFLLHVTIYGLSIPLKKGATTENIRVTFRAYEEDRVRRDADGITDIPTFLPETTVAQVTINGLSVDIHLKRSNNFNDIPLFMSRNGLVEQVFVANEQTIAVYQSQEHGGSFLIMLDHGTDDVTRQKIFGTFYHNMSSYIIQPVEGAAISPNADHALSMVPEQTLVFEPADPKDSAGQFPYNARNARTSGQYGNKRARRQAKIKYSIELFTVVDYKSYQFWYGLASGSDKHFQAMQMIIQYIAYMVNAVDVRYKTITSENFVFEILSAGVYIADTPESSPWSEQKQVNGKVDGSTTLDAFTEWIQLQNNLPQFDHAMGFTGYDVTSSSTSGDSSGKAFTSSLCTPQSTSIVEDIFIFPTMTTAAHELGHSLGAEHDGEGNKCDGEDNFIMASVNSIQSNPVLGQHLWQFSNCSVEEFKSYIDHLDRSNTNCMLSTSAVSQQATTPKHVDKIVYRAVTDPDQQCVNTFGVGSYVCRHLQSYGDTICTGMLCKSPGTTQCNTVTPENGTPCGTWKWCQDGFCVTSPSAPQGVADNCPIGDRPGLYDGTDKTCAQLVAHDAGYCYGDYARRTCCASCKQAETIYDNPYCKYGDYNHTTCQQKPRAACYVWEHQDFCCSTCPERADWYKRGCAFGDKFDGCVKSDCPLYGPTFGFGCCETCPGFITTEPPSTSTTTTKSLSSTPTSSASTITTTTLRMLVACFSAHVLTIVK